MVVNIFLKKVLNILLAEAVTPQEARTHNLHTFILYGTIGPVLLS